MLLEWLEYLFYFKWLLILSQIAFIFLTALFFSSKDFEKHINGKKILLIIAHPDDESMFFIPFLNYFKGSEISLLCLTNGNSSGLGKVREKELNQVSSLLSLKEITILNDEEFPDSMTSTWSSSSVAKAISTYLSTHEINCILTFDDYGVSGHLNHISLYQSLSSHRSSFKSIQMWSLESTSLFRKYIGLFDIIFSSRSEFAVINFNPFLAWKAMSTHNSQFVWYRKLFVVFSRYAYLNTFKPF
jgi:N-acetylglucosaminylphosphatidylinositol deacetylase